MTSYPHVKDRVTVPAITERKPRGPKITAVTAYDHAFARLFDLAGIDMMLVGDSVATVVQGHENTIPVTLDEMIYHCRCVTRGVRRALVIGDMPFMSYQTSVEKALETAGRLVKEGGVSAVKLEGGMFVAETIEKIVQCDIPVVGHVGLTPQSYHRMGGHKVQGKAKSDRFSLKPGSRERVLEDAIAVERAGAFAVVLEGIPSDLAAEITERVRIPTIGIGAGPACDGQILVSHDLLGLIPDFRPKFAKAYANLAATVEEAVRSYISEVQDGSFPSPDYSFGPVGGSVGSKRSRLKVV